MSEWYQSLPWLQFAQIFRIPPWSPVVWSQDVSENLYNFHMTSSRGTEFQDRYSLWWFHGGKIHIHDESIVST